MKKAIVAIVLVVVVGTVGLVAARNAILKSVVGRLVQEETGFGFELGGMEVGLLSTSFEIRDLKLSNPSDFPNGEAFEIARLYVDYDLFSLFTDRPHFHQVVVDIPSATVVVNREGESNLQRLEKAVAPPAPAPSESAPPPEPAADRPSASPAPQAPPRTPAPEPRPEKSFVIDELAMKLGRVSYIDYSGGGPEPREFHHDLGVDLVKKNVTDPADLVGVLTGQLLVGAVLNMDGISNAVAAGLENAMDGVDLQGEDLQKAVDDSLQKVGQGLDKLVSDPDSPLGNLLQDLVGGSEAGDAGQAEEGDVQDALGSFLNDLGIKPSQ